MAKYAPMVHKLPPVQIVLVALTVIGLAIDAFVHFDVAHLYDANNTSTMSEGDLFRLEATGGIVVALLLIVLPRWYTAVLAALAGLVAVLAVIFTYYHSLPHIGPVPKIGPEKPWNGYGDGGRKTLSLIGELLAFLAASGLAMMLRPTSSTAGRNRPMPGPAATT